MQILWGCPEERTRSRPTFQTLLLQAPAEPSQLGNRQRAQGRNHHVCFCFKAGCTQMIKSPKQILSLTFSSRPEADVVSFVVIVKFTDLFGHALLASAVFLSRCRSITVMLLANMRSGCIGEPLTYVQRAGCTVNTWIITFWDCNLGESRSFT